MIENVLNHTFHSSGQQFLFPHDEEHVEYHIIRHTFHSTGQQFLFLHDEESVEYHIIRHIPVLRSIESKIEISIMNYLVKFKICETEIIKSII